MLLSIRRLLFHLCEHIANDLGILAGDITSDTGAARSCGGLVARARADNGDEA
jgi:hypothetical protein